MPDNLKANYSSFTHIGIVGQSLPENNNVKTPPHYGGGDIDIDLDTDLDPYQRGIKYAKDNNLPITETRYREEVVSSNLDEINEQEKEINRQTNYSDDSVAAARTQMRMLKTNNNNNNSQPIENGRAHIEAVYGLVDNIHIGYQKQYGKIIKATTAYMQEVNTALGKLSNHIKDGDAGKIKFNVYDFAMDMDKVSSKYFGAKYNGGKMVQKDCQYYFKDWVPGKPGKKGDPKGKVPVLIEFVADDIQKAFWEKKLSSQGLIVKYNSGKVEIYPDPKPLTDIFNTLQGNSTYWSQTNDIPAQALQTTQTALDSHKNVINNSVSRLLETFRQDNSHFETLTQLLIQLIKDLNQNNLALIN
ncbi:hypothetical protein NQ837_003737 [Providencia rettgeri]|uniref:hypothetical protein n=1 Tax=Providencia TaxID=586 RepID=UPI00065E6BA6|nr:hypothetical protein [Providencia rettgeri]ELR5179023.1 hypothetical protein [Providencia rettgeri]ELR5262839.1 hypothetical protein [Providencia rettgeri]MDK3009674.1 hypothetical protein [Providencia rettgeri]